MSNSDTQFDYAVNCIYEGSSTLQFHYENTELLIKVYCTWDNGISDVKLPFPNSNDRKKQQQ